MRPFQFPHPSRCALAGAILAALLLSSSASWSSMLRQLGPLSWAEASSGDAEPSSEPDASAPVHPDFEKIELRTQKFVGTLPYGSQIERAAEEHELDALLLAAVVDVESSFRPDAISDKGALGLMQLMPYHFDDQVEPFDPQANLDLGADYLDRLSDRFDGDLALALAAYHAGPGAVAHFGGVPPFPATRAYVRRVLSRYDSYRAEALAETDLEATLDAGSPGSDTPQRGF
jgi:soluble lytic murein transglycosylase-like protein